MGSGPDPRGRAAARAARCACAEPGPYQLQAAIAALHVQAPTRRTTDWAQIAALYGALARLAPSPVVEVNRAVALAFAGGPQAGLELLAPLLDDAGLERYQPLHAAHAELLRRTRDAPRRARPTRARSRSAPTPSSAPSSNDGGRR